MVRRSRIYGRSRRIGVSGHILQQRGAGRESAEFAAWGGGIERSDEVDALAQDGNSGTFKSAHERGLLQQLRQVAVLRGIPPDDCFERQRVDLSIVGIKPHKVVPAGCRATVSATWIEGIRGCGS